MHKHLATFAIAFLVIGLFIGCKKENKNDDNSKTKTELITSSSWKFDNAKSGGLDVSSQIPDCWKDNVVTFSADGTGNLNESTNVCDPSAAGPFTWSLQTNETSLHLSSSLFTGGNNDFTIVSLNETNLVVSQNILIPSTTITAEVVFTFKH